MTEYQENHEATKDRDILSGHGYYTYLERQHHVRLRSLAICMDFPHVYPFFNCSGTEGFLWWLDERVADGTLDEEVIDIVYSSDLEKMPPVSMLVYG